MFFQVHTSNFEARYEQKARKTWPQRRYHVTFYWSVECFLLDIDCYATMTRPLF